MKHSLLYFLSLPAVLTLFFSCQKAPELTLTGPSNIELSADGSSASITFTANRDWSISSSESWVSTTPSSGAATDGPVTVSVRCNANTTYEDRTATVTILMDELSQTVTVRQQANLDVIVDTQSIELTSDARSFEIEVQANIGYDVTTSADWINLTGTKGLTSKTLLFSIEANPDYDNAREAMITIKAKIATVADQSIRIRQAKKPIPEGAVDLGIVMTREDGSTYKLLWADKNLGASKPEEYGGYYAWGEIEVKEDDYNWDTYKWGAGTNLITKYCSSSWANYWGGEGNPDNKTELDQADDAANVILGGDWRIPTIAEMKALYQQCDWVWVVRNDVQGYEVRNKVEGNSNSIFLPDAGLKSGSKTLPHEHGYYWSSSLGYPETPRLAACIEFTQEQIRWSARGRWYGQSIRPVTE